MEKLIFVFTISSISLFGLGQTATFSSNFENRNTKADIGMELLETSNGGFKVVTNPSPDAINSSNYVLKAYLLPGKGRAEYSTQRHETNEKKYIYTWKRFHQTNTFKDIKVDWGLFNQWKTWPCEAWPVALPEYDKYQYLICGAGGIFNEIDYEGGDKISYWARAEPDCYRDHGKIPEGAWNEFVLEVYWTNTNKGYYRIWRNNILFGQSDNIKTLFDQFKESECEIYWSNGLYAYWDKTGSNTQDSLIAYIDDITIYDMDSGFTINSVCPDCKLEPIVSTDSNVYRININHSNAEPDGYNNYIASWNGDTSAINLSSISGKSSAIDFYLFSEATVVNNNTLEDECFPSGVITTSVSWNDTKTHNIYLKNLNSSNSYSFKLLAATTRTGADLGTQIWTSEKNRDTVYASGNTCNMAELTNLLPDKNGNLTINVKTIGSTAYINGIELVDFGKRNTSGIKDNIKVYPNPTIGQFILDIKNMLNESVVIEILNISGKTIYQNSISISSNDQLNAIDISNQPAGIYLAFVKSVSSSHAEMIVKIKSNF